MPLRGGPSGLTRSHSATCRSLIRLKPVVRILLSDTHTARTGLEPSWGFSFSYEEGTVGPRRSWTHRQRGGWANVRRGRCPCEGPAPSASCPCRRSKSWSRRCSSRRCRSGPSASRRSWRLPGRGLRSTGSPRCRRLTKQQEGLALGAGKVVPLWIHRRGLLCFLLNYVGSIS